MRFLSLLKYFLLLFLICGNGLKAQPQWQTLPPTPVLPHSGQSGYAPINGAHIWYAVYGQGQPVILLHGSLCNSNYWGNLVWTLKTHYRVIVMDSRGQGRSTRDAKAMSYDLMARDVVKLMDYLQVKNAAVVGWSDGAIIGLILAIHYPARINKLFAYGANSNPNAIADISHSTTFQNFIMRGKVEYLKLSPNPKAYPKLLDELLKMMATQPHFTKADLANIRIPTWIVDGDHDEGIKREDPEWMAANIHNAGLLILPNVNHFAMLQDTQLFNNAVLYFLSKKKWNSTT